MTETSIKPGTILDKKWIIIEPIGKGAMGEVFRAHQINLKRDVAVKTISEEMLKELEDDPEEMEIAFKRFHREVQTMAQVRHINILNIFDYGVHEESDEESEGKNRAIEYIVMEYIPGNSLRFTMSDDGLDDDPQLYADWVKSYFLPILDGVDAMHFHNIFHRDLKPENIFMDGKIPKIADFGLARSYRMKAVSNSLEMKGTLTYMAPEQFSDFRNADHTADIYALGKLLYESVDGKLGQKTLPMKAMSLQKYKNIDIPFLTAMDEIIQKATAEDKNLRYQSIAELRVSLIKALDLDKTLIKNQETLQFKAVEFVQTHSKWIWLGIIICLIAVGGMSIWHFTVPPGEKIIQQSLKEISVQPDTGIDLPENPKDFKLNVIARDGSKLVMTGSPDQSETDATNSKTPLFYIDDRKISVYLFVDFLNAIKEFIRVEKGIVKHKDRIILHIGSGSSDEDQIIFQHERFHLKDATKSSDPVTRVTYHGALKYANFFGRELLTESDWKFSYAFHKNKYLESHPASEEENKEPIPAMMHGTPEKPKPKEIIVLDEMGLKIKEWIKIKPETSEEQNADTDLFSGVIDIELIKEGLKPSLRPQWEGFVDVGFRTKISIE